MSLVFVGYVVELFELVYEGWWKIYLCDVDLDGVYVYCF